MGAEKISPIETLPLRQWFQEFGELIHQDLPDSVFRAVMNKNIPHGLWKKRPVDLVKLNYVHQVWPHTESVGDHIYSVVQNLSTTIPINGVDYLHEPGKDRKGLVRGIRAAALLHDVAKTDPFNHHHPYESAVKSYEYLKLMGLTAEEIHIALLLIEHHDIIGKTVNHLDRQTSIDYISKIFNTPSLLQCAYALTVADISSIEGLKTMNKAILDDVRAASKLALCEVLTRKNASSKTVYSFPKKVLATGFEPVTSRL